jgi:Type VI secretion system effector, Hcp
MSTNTSVKFGNFLGPGGGRLPPDWFEIHSYSFAGSSNFSSGSGQGIGKNSAHEMYFVMEDGSREQHDFAMALFQACNNGGRYEFVELQIEAGSGKSFQYHLTDVLVVSFQTSGSGSGNAVLTHSVGLSFADMGFDAAPPRHGPQRPAKGAVVRAVIAGAKAAVARPK